MLGEKTGLEQDCLLNHFTSHWICKTRVGKEFTPYGWTEMKTISAAEIEREIFIHTDTFQTSPDNPGGVRFSIKYLLIQANEVKL